MVEKLVAEHGVPNGLVHMPFASTSGKKMEDISTDDFSRTLTTALTPAFDLCRNVANRMAANGGGSIVLYSSMYGLVSPDPRIYSAPLAPNPVDYGTSKAGVIQMMRYMAVHYGPKNVRFNAIAPRALLESQDAKRHAGIHGQTEREKPRSTASAKIKKSWLRRSSCSAMAPLS